VASKAILENREPAVPVQKDPDILAAATRMAGEDLCSIADLSSSEVRAIVKLGRDVKRNPRAYRHALDAKQMILMFEKASNALTLVGDPYVARVYDQVAARFHLDEWGQNIRRSITVLESIYQVVSNQAASFRGETLEIAVVLLIVIEILLAVFRH